MHSIYIICSSIIILSSCGSYFGRNVEFFMPNVRPTKHNAQLFAVKKISGDETEYMNDIKIKFDSESVHHIVVYCAKYVPEGLTKGIHEFTTIMKYMYQGYLPNYHGIGGASIGHNPFVIPEGFGYKFGGNNCKYLILHNHYNNITRYQHSETDSSGVIVTMASSVRKESDILVLVPFLPVQYLQPHKKGHVETVLHIEEDIVAHIIQIGIHTHTLGKVVSGYIIRNGQWKLLLKGDPLSYKMWHHVEDRNLTMKKGDILAIRCTYFNDRDESVILGLFDQDEMCMYMIYYYVEGEEFLKEGIIIGNTPWKNDTRIKVPNFIEEDSETLD